MFDVYAGYYEYFVVKSGEKVDFPYMYQFSGDEGEIEKFIDDCDDWVFCQKELESTFSNANMFFNLVDGKIEIEQQESGL